MFFRYSVFEDYDVNVFTTTTDRGVSSGTYAKLNLCPHSGDKPENVRQNKQILANVLDVSSRNLLIPYQTHEDKIRIIDQNFLDLSIEGQQEQLKGIDALVTQKKNTYIGVTTADCVPVSIYDPENHVLGIAHAGWKGTVAQIASKTILAMTDHFSSLPENLLVSIGPSISQLKFEIGDEVVELFQNAKFDMESISYRNSETGKMHIDLWQANKEILLRVGVKEGNIEISGICTYNSQSFFSARRQGLKSGRMLTGGTLK